MKPKPLVVQARVEGGALKVPGRKFLLAALRGWPDMPVDLEIRPFEETRRGKQNRWLWGVVYKEIAKEMGHPVDEVHDLMKLRHNSQTVLDLNLQEVKVGRTTTKLTVAEFSAYIEAVMLDGAEWLGISWPEPRESEEYREAVHG